MKSIKYYLFPFNLVHIGVRRHQKLRPEIKEINNFLESLNLDNRKIDLEPVRDIALIDSETCIIYRGDLWDWDIYPQENIAITIGIVNGLATQMKAAGVFTETQFVEHVRKIHNSVETFDL